jgi:hypothetical protein
MNEHQQRIVELISLRGQSPTYSFAFRTAVRTQDPVPLIKTLVDFGEQGEFYFLRVNSRCWIKYFKGRRIDD